MLSALVWWSVIVRSVGGRQREKHILHHGQLCSFKSGGQGGRPRGGRSCWPVALVAGASPWKVTFLLFQPSSSTASSLELSEDIKADIFVRSSFTVVPSSSAPDDQSELLVVRGVGFDFFLKALPFFPERAVALFLRGIMIQYIEV